VLLHGMAPDSIAFMHALQDLTKSTAHQISSMPLHQVLEQLKMATALHLCTSEAM